MSEFKMFKKIFILGFFFLFNQLTFAGAQHLDDALENLASSIAKSIEGKIKNGRIKSNKTIRIGIKGILQDDRHTVLSDDVESTLAEFLINSNIDVEVFERSKLLNNVKQELQKQNTDFYFDNLSAQEVGRFSAVDILITGEIIKRNYDVSIRVAAIKVSNAQKIATKKVFVHLNEVKDLLFEEKKKQHPLIEKAKSGDINAMTELAINYKKGIGGFPLNAQLAKDWHIKAANLGQPKSQQALGVMYAYGLDSTNKDIEQAMKWFGKSALQENLGAIANIDTLYHNGKVNVKDWIKYIEIAANKDEYYAKKLITYYLDKQDFDNAEYWADEFPNNYISYFTFFSIAIKNKDEEDSKKFACLMLSSVDIPNIHIPLVRQLREKMARISVSCY